MTFDIARVREHYPALAEGYAHFDAAAGSLVAAGSSDAIAAVTRGAVANKTMAFAPGRRAYGIVEEARAAVADLVGGVGARVVFGPSATALTYQVARTLGDTWREGDEVVVSRLDHDANVRPWVQVAGRAGARGRGRYGQRDPRCRAVQGVGRGADPDRRADRGEQRDRCPAGRGRDRRDRARGGRTDLCGRCARHTPRADRRARARRRLLRDQRVQVVGAAYRRMHRLARPVGDHGAGQADPVAGRGARPVRVRDAELRT